MLYRKSSIVVSKYHRDILSLSCRSHRGSHIEAAEFVLLKVVDIRSTKNLVISDTNIDTDQDHYCLSTAALNVLVSMSAETP